MFRCSKIDNGEVVFIIQEMDVMEQMLLREDGRRKVRILS